MRTFLTLVVLALVGYGIYAYWWNPGSESEDGATAKDTTVEAQAEPAGGGQPLQAPPPPNEEDALRKRTADAGPAADAARFDLARLLLEKKTAPSNAEAETLLRQVFTGGGSYTTAAAALLQGSAVGPDQIRYASYLHDLGPESPAYAQACVVLGHSEALKAEESAQINAWELLSEAYFAHDDPDWRDALRGDLVQIVNHLLLSKRMSKACQIYTVKKGDYLAKIAREHNTTVDALKWINGLEGEKIHPGNRLKVLTGVITLEIKKTSFRLDARLDEKYLYSAPVGLGKEGTTPIGDFVIDVKQKDPAWQKVGQPSIPNDDPRNPLGKRWLGFKNTGEYQGYGIHGTSDPETVGRESSEGCIRLHNDDVMLLYRLLPYGTCVTIRE